MKLCVNQFDVYPKVAFAGTRGSYGIEAVLELEFDRTWDGLSKTISFYPSDESTAVSVVLGSDATVKIPYEVMRSAGQAKYVISGTDGENTIVSVGGVLQVVDTLDPAKVIAGEPTASVVEQILAKVTDAQTAAEEAAESAKECERILSGADVDPEEIKGYADSAVSAAGAAASSVSEAQEAAESAAELLEETKASANGAADSASAAKEAQTAAEEAKSAAQEANRTAQEAAKNLVNATSDAFANAITETKKGVMVRLDDVSPTMGKVDVRLSSKNLYDFFADGIAYAQYVTDYDMDGWEFSAKGNVGSGMYSYDSGNVLFPTTSATTISEKGFFVEKGKPYTLSLDYLLREQGIYDKSIGLLVYHEDLSLLVNTSLYGEIGVNKKVSYTFTATKDERVAFSFRLRNNDVTISNIQVEEGTSATPFTSVIEELGGIYAYTEGKNLLDINSVQYPLDDVKTIFWGGIYGDFVFSAKNNLTDITSCTTLFKFHFSDGMVLEYTTDSFSEYPNGMPISGYLYKIEAVNCENVSGGSVDEIQLELGTAATEFEPYRPRKIFDINEDGIVKDVELYHPVTTLFSADDAVVTEVTYNKDTNKVIERLANAIKALGGKL